MKAFVSNLVRLTVPALIVAFLLLELVFRFAIPASDPPRGWFDEAHGVYRFATSRPTGIVTIGAFAQQRGRWHINDAGWNSPVEYVRSKSKPRIAIIGDSYVEAFQVDSDKSYPSVLRNLLGNSFDIYSFGVSGAPLSQYLYMGRYVVEQFDPDLLIFNIVHNDFDESLEHINGSRIHFMRLRLQDHRITEVAPIPDPSFAQFSPTRRILGRSALARYLLFNLGVRNRLDRLRHPRVQYVANIDPSVIAQAQADIRRATHYVVDRMVADFVDRPILFVMDAPDSIYSGNTNASIQFLHALTAEVCAEAGIGLLDLTEPMRDAYQKNHMRFESEWDDHWNEYGHRFVADALGKLLRKRLLDRISARYEPSE